VGKRKPGSPEGEELVEPERTVPDEPQPRRKRTEDDQDDRSENDAGATLRGRCDALS
jgi:hypothetical protein